MGKHQLVTPKDIVGALANEGGIESRFIGQINLYEDYSTVELPADLPNDVMGALARLRVRQHVLHLRPVTPDENAHDDRRARTPRGPQPSERKPRKAFDKAPRNNPPRSEGGDRPPRARKKF